ncbi:Ribonuclease VapC49 [subsurface metagenome]
MIIYTDSSALVKKYSLEQDSTYVINCLEKADAIAISVVGYAEILSALSRKKRDNDLTEKDFKILLRAFEDDWESFILVEVSAALNAMVKQILLDFPLRGFDSIHLASARLLKNITKKEIAFLAYDEKLANAAENLGLNIKPE